jgi:septal ring factor EnvC (AmiA/AmiB activator)
MMVALSPRPAAADQVSDLKAQATAVSQKLIQEQLQIGAYQQQFSFATQKVAADARLIIQIGSQISGDELRIKKDTSEVRRQAITTYMDADTGLSSSDSLIFTGDVENVSLADEYSSLSTGYMETSIDQLRTAQNALHAHQATLLQEQSQDQADQKSRAVDLAQAENTEQQMESEQRQVTGKLATAVAAQAAAQARSAAAAITAAQEEAQKAAQKAAQQAAQQAAQPTAGSSPVPAPSGGSVTGSDPALNPFLQCVVQVESGGDYQDVSPNGLYMGAFQFSQPTWNVAAQDAGLSALVGVHPNVASKADQDSVAVALYALDGQQPWLGDRCN